MSDGQDNDGADAPFRRTVMICNRRGLHARAAARFVKLADQFDAEIIVAKNGAAVSGRSIMGLMMLAAGPGTANCRAFPGTNVTVRHCSADSSFISSSRFGPSTYSMAMKSWPAICPRSSTRWRSCERCASFCEGRTLA